MCLIRIKFLLIGWHLLTVFTWIPLVAPWSRLERLLFPLALAWWEVCSLMSHQIDLWCLGFTCNLFNMMYRSFRCLHLFCKLPDFACRNLLQIYIAIIYALGNKLFIFQKEPEYISMQDTCCFWWVLGKRHLCLYCIVPLTYWSISLSEACKQVKSCSDFICLWLAKIFILGPNFIQAKIFCRQTPGNILIHSKISTPHYDFLALLRLMKHCKFAIKNILTHSVSILEIYSTGYHSQSNLSWDPSIYDINTGGTNCCTRLGDGWKIWWSFALPISWSEIEDSCETNGIFLDQNTCIGYTGRNTLLL